MDDGSVGSNVYDVIVVGGAAAGLSAALYTARQGLKTLVLTKDIGGQMLLTDEIQNYPGFPSISGFDLANKLKEHAEAYGVEFVYDELVGIEESSECGGLCFKLKTPYAEYHALSVVLAFGKTPRDLGVPGEQEFKGRGVSYCSVCDGPLFKSKNVVVVGVGDQGLDAVNYLANLCSTIYYVFGHDRPIGSQDLVEEVLRLPNIRPVPNSKVVELVGNKKLERVVVENTKTKERTEIPADGIFIEIGYVAKTDFLKGFLQLNEKKEIVVDKEGRTSRQGVFAAGDVTDTPYKQAVISAGQGSTAALSAYNYVQRIKGKPASSADWRSLKPKQNVELKL
ncbi:thioredoxin reductase [Candidatus Marsarchaeota G2 archaeon OSP_D]|jgi:thioredoxin reductase (NADPH)|uniref:Thioredoxin reductase n=5 Tax=Candidatus Marsarchaeota group 2 TaxID=2203771 RepID=A0A2R6CDI8_9ARCH|nr:MAG: thioredoxin reductase [Candidatus Marsarchaeota G2 archaeon OSP_D]PSN93433.1 MAG: thioredoxin reductase [Candidatus Marsarchaeota G2 archaeon ECH_B_2]PSN97827.1 MAG: thioredoxin reductase [Candidatus Marsarchaeota G2 archaeon ECH_B_3]PSN99218.1 MAG: thioredoxin reductase [Candidatus Marsarchaeota G2 archaeon ECH_B_1]PSO08948.1 MAG: thioredoxin reductase [Candidatus Marsarchaeota G2 archaeon BE_D]